MDESWWTDHQFYAICLSKKFQKSEMSAKIVLFSVKFATFQPHISHLEASTYTRGTNQVKTVNEVTLPIINTKGPISFSIVSIVLKTATGRYQKLLTNCRLR